MIESRQYERPKTILIVDDQEIIRDALGAMLEDQYELLYAENGQEALKMMQEHLEELSIVLLDLIMPDDMTYFGAQEAARDCALRIPEDISFTGYDGIPLTQALTPRLTTIRQNSDTMGKSRRPG